MLAFDETEAVDDTFGVTLVPIYGLESDGFIAGLTYFIGILGSGLLTVLGSDLVMGFGSIFFKVGLISLFVAKGFSFY